MHGLIVLCKFVVEAAPNLLDYTFDISDVQARIKSR